MAKKDYISRYLLIVQKLRQQPYASYEDIAGYISTQLHIQECEIFTKRTFQRDLADIKALFDIEIIYSRQYKGYYIETNESNFSNFNRMVEAFDVFQSLLQTDALKSYFHFENRLPIGTQYIQRIINAIKNRYEIQFRYNKDWEKAEPRTVNPLLLKEYKSRWYLVAEEKKNASPKIFALDRVSHFFETGIIFTYPTHFNPTLYFKNCFGIYRSDKETIKTIVMETNIRTGNYLISKPLHETQQMIKQTSSYYRFSLELFITYDLVAELLSLGSHIKIIAPASLQKILKEHYQEALKLYK